MRRSLLTATAAAAALFASSVGIATAAPGSSSAAPSSSSVSDSASEGTPTGWIVVLKDGTAPGHVAARHSEAYGATVGHVYRHALKGYSARMSETAAARVADDRRVLFVQRDGVVSIAAPGGSGKPDNGKGKPVVEVEQPPQSLPTGINRANADASPTAAIDNAGLGEDEIVEVVDVDVAVIDTGIDVDHPDLNVVGGVNCSTGNSYDDGNGHGTHVAGTIGAKDDAHGVVGMAPGARLWAVRVLNNAGSGTWSSVICGIDWVTDHAGDIEVANMSLGGSGADDGACGSVSGDGMHESICGSVAAGVTYVVSAGNSGADAKNSVPAAYDEVITVSALADGDGLPGGLLDPSCRTDVDDTFANFSNFGTDVDLIAPGVCINSTWKGGGYDTISGTSMASPHVAGGAALFIAGWTVPEGSTATRPTPTEVQSRLVSTSSTDWIWTSLEDPDGIKEPLLDVSGF